MAIGTAAALLGSSLIGGGLSLFGGKKQADASKSAAQIQAEAAEKARLETMAVANETAPYITGGAATSAEQVRKAAGEGITRVDEATVESNKLLDPYRVAGDEANEELRRNLVAGGDFNRTPTMADIQLDPGYAFRIAEAQKAMERGAAARGAVQGGGFYKDLNKHIQGEASQEFQSAFERFRNTTKDRFSNLFSVSGRGKDAATQQGDSLVDAGKTAANLNLTSAEYAGDRGYDAAKTVSNNLIGAAQTGADLTTQAANARAAGQVAGSGALWGGVNGGFNSVNRTLQLRELLKNPARGVNLFTEFRGIGGTGIT